MSKSNTERFFNVIRRSLFHKNSNLSYTRTLEAVNKLCECILAEDETNWYIGEFSEVTLDFIIVGTFWFLNDYHSGQNSLEYSTYCNLGRIFDPGMSSLEDDTSEKDVYQMWESKLKD